MKNAFMKSIKASILLSGLVLGGVASAADGEITFIGKVTSNTCTINGGQPNFDVTLPTVSTQTLNEVGKTAGRTPFRISLTGCTSDLNTVAAYFEPGANTSLDDNRLINTAGAGGAENVQIQLRNQDQSIIKLGGDVVGQGVQKVTVNNGSAELVYFAEYFATGITSAGDVKGNTEYTIIYP